MDGQRMLAEQPAHHTEFLTRAHNFNISNLEATTIGRDKVTYNSNTTIIGGNANLASLDPIPNASHTRNRKTSPPNSSCHPGTRQGVIAEVTTWATSPISSSSHTYWLHGYVGGGKSAIAQAVAETLEERKQLAASFFFFRGSGDRSRTTKLAVTLASQVALSIPETGPLIVAAIQEEPGLLTSGVSLVRRLERLVYNPVAAAAKSSDSSIEPYIIVVDGLDECEDQEEVEEMLDHMLEFFQQNPRIPLRFFITSRVEEHIRACLGNGDVLMDNLDDHSSIPDIGAFVIASFKRAAKRNRVIQALAEEWPAKRDVDAFIKSTGGSFIFASTLLNYVLAPSKVDGLTPMDRLPLAIDNSKTGLDGLYAQTLARSKDLPHFSDIISTIALLRCPLPLPGLAELLAVEKYKILHVLLNLQAIIQVPGDDESRDTLPHLFARLPQY